RGEVLDQPGAPVAGEEPHLERRGRLHVEERERRLELAVERNAEGILHLAGQVREILAGAAGEGPCVDDVDERDGNARWDGDARGAGNGCRELAHRFPLCSNGAGRDQSATLGSVRPAALRSYGKSVRAWITSSSRSPPPLAPFVLDVCHDCTATARGPTSPSHQ